VWAYGRIGGGESGVSVFWIVDSDSWIPLELPASVEFGVRSSEFGVSGSEFEVLILNSDSEFILYSDS
jgi:hypothetical protein